MQFAGSAGKRPDGFYGVRLSGPVQHLGAPMCQDLPVRRASVGPEADRVQVRCSLHAPAPHSRTGRRTVFCTRLRLRPHPGGTGRRPGRVRSEIDNPRRRARAASPTALQLRRQPSPAAPRCAPPPPAPAPAPGPAPPASSDPSSAPSRRLMRTIRLARRASSRFTSEGGPMSTIKSQPVSSLVVGCCPFHVRPALQMPLWDSYVLAGAAPGPGPAF